MQRMCFGARQTTLGRGRHVGVVAICVAAGMLATALPAPAAHTATAAPRLLAQWHLDEGAPCGDSLSSTPDASGNGKGLALRNTCEGPGKLGRAMRFPGDAFTAGPGITPSRLTVSLWVRATKSPGPSRYLFSQGSSVSCTPAAYAMYTSFAGDVNAGGLYFYVNHAGTAHHAPGIPPARIWDGSWHNVAGTFDGVKVRFYLDGAQVGNGTPVPGPIDYVQADDRFVLGSYGKPGGGACAPAVPSVGFVGEIDEVEISDDAIEQTVQHVGDFGSAAPKVRTTGVGDVTETTARVSGTLEHQYVQQSGYRVEYGTTTAYGQTSAIQKTATAAGLIAVGVTLTGLEPDTVYHARLVSPESVVPGDGVTFRTAASRPAVPVTTILLDPAAPLPAGFYDGYADVTVKAAGRGTLETRCVLDPDQRPQSFADLPSGCRFGKSGRVATPGRHTVWAATRDEAGATEAPLVSRSFTISQEPDTTITSGPEGETWWQNARYTFTSTVLPATFECAVDGKPFAQCTSPFVTGALGSGDHTFAVRAIAPGGAVDPTPAIARLAVASPIIVRGECFVSVRYWLITGRSGTGLPDQTMCQIGTPAPGSGCHRVVVCQTKPQRCPSGARCTITTRASWADADTGINWGVRAISTLGYVITTAEDTSPPSALSRIRPEPTAKNTCVTGLLGDRCTITATLPVLGPSAPLLSICEMELGSPTFGYRVSSPDDLRPLLTNSVRRIECTSEWRIEPAPELAAVVSRGFIQLRSARPGTVVATATIQGVGGDDRAAGEKPTVEPIRTTVTGTGPTNVRLVLSPGAKSLLEERGKLVVNLRLTTTPRVGRPVIRTQRVTITAPQTATSCPAPAISAGARARAAAVLACLLARSPA